MAGKRSRQPGFSGLRAPSAGAVLKTSATVAATLALAGCGGTKFASLSEVCDQPVAGNPQDAPKAAAQRRALTRSAIAGAQKVAEKLEQSGTATTKYGVTVSNEVALNGPDKRPKTGDEPTSPQLSLSYDPDQRTLTVGQSASKPNPTAEDFKNAEFNSRTGILPQANQDYIFKVGPSNTIVQASKKGDLEAKDFSQALEQPVKLVAAQANADKGYSSTNPEINAESEVYFPGCKAVIDSVAPLSFADEPKSQVFVPESSVITDYGSRAGLYAETAAAIQISGQLLDQTQ